MMMNTPKRQTLTFFATVLAITLAHTVSATLLFEETFPLGSGAGLYETGNVLGQPGEDGDWEGDIRLGGGGIHGGSGGTGGFFPEGDGSNFGVQSGGHSYPGLITGDARLAGGTYLNSVGDAAGTRRVNRNVDNFPTVLVDTGTYYFSVTGQAPSVGSLGSDEYILGGFYGSQEGGSIGFGFGFRGDEIVLHGRGFDEQSSLGRAFVTFDDGTGSPVTYTPGQEYFMVLEYNSSNNRAVTATLNPDLTGTNDPLGTFSSSATYMTAGGSSGLEGLELYSMTTTTDQNNLTYASFGDYRIGETFESVSPIPEPGTLALVGISLMALVLMRRRKG
ncbi:MAG: PEP-CTERM sorting domain-containing protein [Opitutales bacterium]